MRPNLLALALLTIHSCLGQPIAANRLSQRWEAQWIAHPAAHLKAYEVLHFRKTFPLAEPPPAFIVHVSADSRYKLFVNGKMVGLGPARSDLDHWNFDT